MHGFWFELTLSLRNLFRSPRRTTFTLLACIIGMVGLTLLDGYITYSMWGLKQTIIRSGTGHVQVARDPGYFRNGDNDPTPYLWEDYSKQWKRLSRLPSVTKVLPTLTVWSIMQNQGRSQSVLLRAFPVESGNDWSFRKIISGRDLEEGDSQVVVGSGLAHRLKVVVGDSLDVYAASVNGSVNLLSLKIKGVFQSGIRAYDQTTAFLDLRTAQELIQQEAITHFTVLGSIDDESVIVREAATSWDDLGSTRPATATWQELSPFFQEANSSYSTVLLVARLIVILIAFLAISNTLSLSVVERLRELGTVRSFGGTPGEVVRVLSWEGLLLGLLGGVLGLGFGLLVCAVLNLTGGVWLPAQPGMSEALQVLFTPDLGNGWINVVWTILSALLGTLLAVVGAVRQTIATLLRSES